MERRSQHGTSRISDRRDTTSSSTFRVHTLQDFVGPGHGPPKRKVGLSTTACKSCRIKKVKCVVTDSQKLQRLPVCEPCRHSQLDCNWDIADGRKRRKGRSQAALPHDHPSPPSARHTTGGAPAVVPEGPSPTSAHNARQDRRAHHQELNDGVGKIGNPSPPTYDRYQGPLPGLTPFFETQIDSNGMQVEQQFLAEFLPSGNTMVPNDWPDLQNLVLGFDFMNPGNRGSSQAVESPDGRQNVHSQFSPNNRSAKKPRLLRLRYYRRFGPTAVVPGLRRMSVVVDPSGEREQDESLLSDRYEADCLQQQQGPWSSASPASAPSPSSTLFNGISGEPHPDIMPQILDIFFQRFGGYFPFLHPQILGGHIKAGEGSSFLLNAIAAVTVRFCPLDGPLSIFHGKSDDIEWRRGSPFLKKAKEQLVPLFNIPEPEVVAGLLILAWAEFGDNNDTGVWMFAGMAIRMAQDLGLHRLPETNLDARSIFHDHARPSPDGRVIFTDEQSALHQQKARLVMFWSVFIMDICVSLGTGRQPTIRRSEVENAIPTIQDMKLVQLRFDDSIPIHNILFPEVCRFMLHFSEAVEALNEPPQTRAPSNNEGNGVASNLSRIRDSMLQSYTSLSPELLFSAQNYTASLSSSQSGLFLMLHLYFLTFTILLSNNGSREARQSLQQVHAYGTASNVRWPYANGTGNQNPATFYGGQGRVVAAVARQKMIQYLTIAELVDKSGYVTSPFTSHCFFVAASTILQEELSNCSDWQQPQQQPLSGENLLGHVADSDYEFLYNKLKEQGQYFGAVNSAISVLDRKQKAMFQGQGQAERDANQVSDEDVEGDDSAETVVGLGDPGIVNRYTIPAQ